MIEITVSPPTLKIFDYSIGLPFPNKSGQISVALMPQNATVSILQCGLDEAKLSSSKTGPGRV